MPSDKLTPVLNPVLRFLKDPKPKPIVGGGKNAKGVKRERLAKQRKSLAGDLREMISMASDQPTFAGRMVVYASMFDDSLATSWRPNDLLSANRGAKFIAPFKTGYLIELERRALESLAAAVGQSERVLDLVDISRVQALRYFDEDDASGEFSLDEIWKSAPSLRDPCRACRRPGGRFSTRNAFRWNDHEFRPAFRANND